MSVRKQVFLKRVTFVARHNPHQAMMRLLARGASFEFRRTRQ